MLAREHADGSLLNSLPDSLHPKHHFNTGEYIRGFSVPSDLDDPAREYRGCSLQLQDGAPCGHARAGQGGVGPEQYAER